MTAPLYVSSEIYRHSSYGPKHPLAVPRVSVCTDLCHALGWLPPEQYREAEAATDAQITLVVPALIRNELQHNKTVTINGYITRRVVNNASRIEIQLTVTELVGQTQNKYSDDEQSPCVDECPRRTELMMNESYHLD